MVVFMEPSGMHGTNVIKIFEETNGTNVGVA
jgi:hypothetical protein